MISEAAAALAAQAILASSKLARKSTMARGGTRISRSDAGGPAGSNSSGGGAVVMVTGTGNASATSGGGMGEIKEEDTPNPPGGIRGGSGMLEYEAARKVRFNEEDVIGHEAGEMQDKLRTGSGSWTATSGGAAASAAAAMRARSRSSSLPVLSENDHSILRGAQDGASAPLSDPNAAASSGHDLFDWTKKSFVPDHVKNPHRCESSSSFHSSFHLIHEATSPPPLISPHAISECLLVW